MKRFFFILFFLAVQLSTFSQETVLKEGNIPTDRTKTNINLNWKFYNNKEINLKVPADALYAVTLSAE